MVDQPQTEVGQIHQTDGESGEADSKIQKEAVGAKLAESVELVPNWSSRIGAKLGLLPTHKYWTAFAYTEIKTV